MKSISRKRVVYGLILILSLVCTAIIFYYIGKSTINSTNPAITSETSSIKKQNQVENKTKTAPTITTPVVTNTKTSSSIVTQPVTTAKTSLISEGEFMISGSIASTTPSGLVLKTAGDNLVSILSSDQTVITGSNKFIKNPALIALNSYATITVRINVEGQFIATIIKLL